jgi:hypothetical protein
VSKTQTVARQPRVLERLSLASIVQFPYWSGGERFAVRSLGARFAARAVFEMRLKGNRTAFPL